MRDALAEEREEQGSLDSTVENHDERRGGSVWLEGEEEEEEEAEEGMNEGRGASSAYSSRRQRRQQRQEQRLRNGSNGKGAASGGGGGGGNDDDNDDVLARFAGGPWDPNVAVCSRKGCQGCAYHRLRSQTEKDWPGPGEYVLPALGADVGGGRFSLANPKSMLEWVEYREKQQPGPADHTPARAGDKSGPVGGRLNLSNSKSMLEWVEYHAASKPGPADHPHVGTAFKATVAKHGGTGPKFSLGNPKSELDWKLLEHSHFPGPGDHGDCGPKAMSKLGRVRESSGLGTFGVEDHHHEPTPPAAQMPRSLRVPGRGRWLPDP